MKSTAQLRVFLNDILVGSITRLPDERTIFSFDRAYAADPNRPVLSLSYKAEDGALIQDTKLSKQKLAPFFSNLLPEGHLRDYLAGKAGVHRDREFFLLAALGDDLPGAVRVEFDGDLADEQGGVEKAKSGRHRDADTLRFSLAGIQLKFSALLETTGQLTIPVHGTGGHWIVKLPAGGFQNVPDAEFAMLTLARAAGITVPQFKLVPTCSIGNLPERFRETSGASLAVKRFDRAGSNRRIHMEDFAQVFGLRSSHKYKYRSYANIAEVLWVEAGEESLREFLRRLVFTIAIGNGDMHLKNWSLLYLDERKPELAPAYDFIPTIAFIENQELGLSLGGERQFGKITRENFQKLAADARLPERYVLRSVDESIEAVRAAWEEQKASLPLAEQIAREIEQHLKSLRLFSLR